MKTVSVIIAAYRADSFILEAIDSVLMQQLPDDYRLELVVGIDGCEKTGEVLSGAESGGVLIYRMKRNYGTYITFNTMMQFASGDLIVRFDADDVMLQSYLEKQIAVFEQEPEVYLTWTRNRYIDTKGQFLPEMDLKDDDTLQFWQVRSPSNGQFMMRRELWTELGGFRPWRTTADTDFLFRMRFLGLTEHGIDEVLYYRRVHPHSLTQSKETGYDSQLRKETRAEMNEAKETRATREDCRVEPITGEVEDIKPGRG